jgi:uncharacterized membrane protein YfcA
MLPLVFFAAAALYSSVGHAGASSYLAVMSFLGIPANVMRPTALALNVGVATVAAYRFGRAGLFRWSLFWPFALGSMPFASVGGTIVLPGHWYRLLVGLILWIAAGLLVFRDPHGGPNSPLPTWLAVVLGAGIGLLSGLTGMGGGVFLGPLLLLRGWADARETSGASAAFNLLNSVAALAGQPKSLAALPQEFPVWLGAAIVGAFLGSEVGSRRAKSTTLRRMLAVVLVLAGAKQIFA